MLRAGCQNWMETLETVEPFWVTPENSHFELMNPNMEVDASAECSFSIKDDCEVPSVNFAGGVMVCKLPIVL